jgi:hypothetical protein
MKDAFLTVGVTKDASIAVHAAAEPGERWSVGQCAGVPRRERGDQVGGSRFLLARRRFALVPDPYLGGPATPPAGSRAAEPVA